MSERRLHSPASCNHGRGCPDCTGMTWAELHENEREQEREQERNRETLGLHEWRTR